MFRLKGRVLGSWMALIVASPTLPLVACANEVPASPIAAQDEPITSVSDAGSEPSKIDLMFPVPTPGDFASASFAEAADFIMSQCDVRTEQGEFTVWSTSDMNIASDGSVGLTSTTPGQANASVSFHVKDVYVYDLFDSSTLEVRTEIFGTDQMGPRLIAVNDRRVDVAYIYCNEWKRVPQAFARLRELMS